jgi:molecular chaperone GrpE
MAEPSIRELADKVDDLSRLVARQSGALGQLADARRRPGTDVALLVDLHALRGDALAAAAATRSGKERGAFEAIATGLERLLAGRGGVLVVPRPGHPFSAATMEAAEEVRCADAALDRTVAALVAPGLEADGRTVRPAKVTVHRYAPPPGPVEPEPEPRPAAADNGHSGAVNGRKASRRADGPAANGTANGTGPAAAESAAPARRTPAKRAARKQPTGKGQPTSAMTSSDTSKFA